MTLDELIDAAQRAVGGLDRLRAIRTYHAELRRVRESGAASTVLVWRAAGGRVRVEERLPEGRVVRVTGGPAETFDPAERAELLRDARIAPRNMLAHAAEHALALRGRPAPDGSHIVSFPAEFVLYLFDASTFRCRRLIDLMRRRRIEFENYREVDGVVTPFVERHVGADQSFADLYMRVAYDVDVPDKLFTAAGRSRS
jgi:hypothetical protein